MSTDSSQAALAHLPVLLYSLPSPRVLTHHGAALGLQCDGCASEVTVAIPRGTSTVRTSLPSLFLQHAVPKMGKKEKIKPYSVSLAIYSKKPLKHFLGNTKQGWEISDLSIESWVQYM